MKVVFLVLLPLFTAFVGAIIGIFVGATLYGPLGGAIGIPYGATSGLVVGLIAAVVPFFGPDKPGSPGNARSYEKDLAPSTGGLQLLAVSRQPLIVDQLITDSR